MKRKLLSYLLIMSLFLCGLPAKTGSAEGYKYAVEGEDEKGRYVINISPKFNASHYINGYCFSDMSYYNRAGATWMICTVTNVSDVARDVVLTDIHIYDDTGMEMTCLGGIIGDLEPGESTQFNASATSSSIVDAYDYTMTFAQSDYLDPDEEITIKKGVVCTSHEIKENDTVTLICEESDEGVVYQWFWSDNGYSGGGNRIEGANGRKLILPNVSLEQYGLYYYCQINKKGVIEYTDRFELVITPVTTPKPTAGASPSPTVADSPEPTVEPTVKPTAEPTVKPTVKPTEKPTEKPTTEPTEKPTAEPDETPGPSPLITPDATAVPDFDTSPEPAVSPDITASPEQPFRPSPDPSPSGMPDTTSGPSPAPEGSPSPEPSPATSPQVSFLLKVKKIRVQQTSNLKAKLTWKKITADKIAVLRAEKKSGPYRIIKQFSGDKTSYTDKTAKRGKTYYYKIVAHNGDLQVQLSQKDLTVKKITVSYLISPVISVKKGNSSGQKYVQIFLQKYEGQYADIYMKAGGRFQKLAMKKRTIRAYRKKYRFRYRSGGVTLYFRVRTYQIVKGRKRISPYSKTVKIEI